MPTKKKYLPAVTKTQFDALSDRLRDELKSKFEEMKADADKPPSDDDTSAAFDYAAELDSKTVARWSPIIKKHLDCRLDPELIRKGGYNSFDEFWDDMAPKLRAACSDESVSAAALSDAARE